MNVVLLAHTPDPEKLVAAAARSCYSKHPASYLYDHLTADEVEKMVRTLLDDTHTSPLEHASFTFSIEGITRACATQLVRHRIASHSQQSQRYVDMANANFSVPGSILLNAANVTPAAKDVFFQVLSAVNKAYQYLTKTCFVLKEDARSILPQAAQTNIVTTMNAAELYHFFDVRCCSHAQTEMRELAASMLKLVKAEAPVLFNKAGAACVHFGYCPETTRSCHKAPTMQELLAAWKKTREA